MSSTFRKLLDDVFVTTVSVVNNLWEIYSLRIHGIEVTQGTQYFRSDQHLVDNFGADNSVRLVARKPAWVRVYLRSGAFPSVANVSGTLKVERSYKLNEWNTLTTLTPQPPGAVTALADPDYDAERADITQTLNFIIPTDLMCGLLRLTATVDAPGGHHASATLEVPATLHQRLFVRGILISYDGPDKDGNPIKSVPTEKDLKQIGGGFVHMFPVASDAHFSVGGSFTNTKSVFGNNKEGCGHVQNWGGLETKFLEQKNADMGGGPGFIYVGLVAEDTPGANSAGCAGTEWVFSGAGEDVSASLDVTYELTAEVTMAHELGHHFEFKHAPGYAKPKDDPDPNYPVYKSILPGTSYIRESIGEYGLNVNDGSVYAPKNDYGDFMAYSPRRWISPYNWNRMLFHSKLNPTIVCNPVPPWSEQPVEWPLYSIDDVPKPYQEVSFEPVICLIGIMGLGGHFRVDSVTRSAVAETQDGETTPYIVELLGEEDERLAADVLRYNPSYGSRLGGLPGAPSEVVLYAYLPDAAPGLVLRVMHEGDEIWRREAPSKPAVIRRFTAEVTEDGTLAASWSAGGESELNYWLRWSTDGEEVWNGLAVGLRGDEAEVDLGHVSPGTAFIQLVAHDGFFSTVSEPVEIHVPRRPLDVMIVYPAEKQPLYAGRSLRLLALHSGGTGQRFDNSAFTWFIGGREVGRGSDVFVKTPPPGEHKYVVRLEVNGETAVDERSVRTYAPPTVCP